ncbi:rod shape-determining protein MreD [Thiomicrorhabdus xiamenensis]|uniref:Rod shape-determining protein MreD n=1 Tax=Thiomicrorhabdus xiamenensis TaxID=2739063 RepID=A0A7D4NLY1_9GAMM|nr:rod shape-determining protein MreD [Thiomicrorhabdus xiamenensis]QKI89674.1 rod shape-determining protein MreD [Thiomicrorhabdus xiamenensis]
MGDNFIYISSRQVRWLIVLSFVFALILDSINIIGQNYLFLPPFTLLVLLYWAGHFLDYTYMGTAFAIGLFADTIYQNTLGVHALIYVVLTFAMLRHRLRFRGYTIWQQSLNIVGFCFIYQIMHLFTLAPKLDDQQQLAYWIMPLVGGVLWALIALSLNRLSQQNVTEN